MNTRISPSTHSDPYGWLLGAAAAITAVLVLPWTSASAYISAACVAVGIASWFAARAGAFKNDATIAGVVCIISLLLLVFVAYPIGRMLLAAFIDEKGHWWPTMHSSVFSTLMSGALDVSPARCAAASPSTR